MAKGQKYRSAAAVVSRRAAAHTLGRLTGTLAGGTAWQAGSIRLLPTTTGRWWSSDRQPACCRHVVWLLWDPKVLAVGADSPRQLAPLPPKRVPQAVARVPSPAEQKVVGQAAAHVLMYMCGRESSQGWGCSLT